MLKYLRKKLRIEKHYKLNKRKVNHKRNCRRRQKQRAAELMGENVRLTWKKLDARFNTAKWSVKK